jgi:hypothetical protein
MALETEFVIRAPFTTQRVGRVDVEVDWTYATNDVDVILTRGVCTFAQFEAMQCEVLSVAASTSVKPERLSIAGAAAGSYTLFIVNLGPEDDSVAWQVVQSASAASASTSAGWWSQAEPTRARLQAPWLKR